MYVGRPTRWGNPWTLLAFTREEALKHYRIWLNEQLQKDPTFLDPLKGKDLACWCPVMTACHADIILEVLGGTAA